MYDFNYNKYINNYNYSSHSYEFMKSRPLKFFFLLFTKYIVEYIVYTFII